MDIFDLTPLTLQVNQDRRMSFEVFDVNRRHFWIFVVSTVVILPMFVFLYALCNLGVVAIIASVLMYAAPFYLIETRTQDGMKLRRYQTLLHSKQANTGKFMICNKEIHPGTYRPRILRSLSLPVAGRTPDGTTAPSPAESTALLD